jgi:superfamily I DNA/RNA helicase
MYKEVNWICEQIETLINSKQAKADEIAVLTRNGSPLFYVEEELAKQEINSLLIMGKVRQEMRPDHVTLSTVHSSKGLEWKYVYLNGSI